MFKDYKSKPITRQAHEVTSEDKIVKLETESTYRLTCGKDTVVFKAYEKVEVGDYVVRLKADDIYHCSREVFKERNIL